MEAALTLSSEVGIKHACEALDVARAGFYRTQARKDAPSVEPRQHLESPRSLSSNERQEVLDILHTDRFMDKAPYEVYATLLDEGQDHCSIRTMYRILDENKEVKERRNQLSHPVYHKPELLATAPNQVWSWDITKLLGPAKWTYFYLYVIMDIFSRYVVGWMIAPAESAVLAERLSSKLLSTVRTFPIASAASRTPGVSARISFHGITKSIDILASACLRQKPCITALHRTCR